MSFTTAGPRIEKERSESVGSKAAILSANVVAGEEPTIHYHVEYGTSVSYGSSTAPVEVARRSRRESAYWWAQFENYLSLPLRGRKHDGNQYGPDLSSPRATCF